jgi:hypothetical protein
MSSGPQINDEPETQSLVSEKHEPATQPLVSATTGDRCVSCGTPLSSDQRYCVACGERRGKPRFSLPAGGSAGSLPSSDTAATTVTAPPPPPRAPRASSGTTIVAGVGTLLLAMGVGVLIGRDSANNVNTRPVQAAAPTVIHVGGGTGSGSAAAAPTKSAKKSSRSGTHKAKSKTKTASKPTAAQAAKASNAASKVLGSSNKNLPPATVTVGQSGHGPGYNKSGKFDGSFFGN